MLRSPPRVLHVLNELKYSGAEVMLSSGHKELNARGSMIVSTGMALGEYAGHLGSSGYELVHLPFERSTTFFRDLRRTIKRFHPDVVHVHTERYSTPICCMARASGYPVVRSIHNEFQFSGTLRLKRLVDRNFAKWCGVKFISCSSRVRSNEMKRFWNRTSVINNWIDLSRIRNVDDKVRLQLRTDWGIPKDAFLTISIANEARAKNLMALFEAVGRLDDRHYHIHLGFASDNLRRGATYFCGRRVIFTGVQADIGYYLSASDAFVCSSTFEGGPLVLMEAAASGLPCITTDVGIATSFRDLAGVVIVDPSSYSLCQGINSISSMSRSEIKEASVILADFARQNFIPEIGANKYAELYNYMRVI